MADYIAWIGLDLISSEDRRRNVWHVDTPNNIHYPASQGMDGFGSNVAHLHQQYVVIYAEQSFCRVPTVLSEKSGKVNAVTADAKAIHVRTNRLRL